jgi:hypothetical protein
MGERSKADIDEEFESTFLAFHECSNDGV